MMDDWDYVYPDYNTSTSTTSTFGGTSTTCIVQFYNPLRRKLSAMQKIHLAMAVLGPRGYYLVVSMEFFKTLFPDYSIYATIGAVDVVVGSEAEMCAAEIKFSSNEPGCIESYLVPGLKDMIEDMEAILNGESR